MEREVKDRNLLNEFARDFVKVLDKAKIMYIIVSGFVALAHGRSRGTEDIDVIIEKIPLEKFAVLHNGLKKAGFECIQGGRPRQLFVDYLEKNISIRYARKNEFIPQLELKLAKDALDEKQIGERVKLPLTGLPFYFSSIETNIAFKEALLKSPKDIEDAKHLRIIYSGKLNEAKIREIKRLIKKYRLSG